MTVATGEKSGFLYAESYLGQTRLIEISMDSGAMNLQQQQEERDRKQLASLRRLYAAGQQYDAQNYDTALTYAGCGIGTLPEHKRKHAYSTQIQEAVDFLSDRLGSGFRIEAAAPPVQDIVNAMVAATDTINCPDENGEMQVVTDDLLRDAMIGGDVPTRIRWDPVEQRIWLEFWETEHVEWRMKDTRVLDRVVQTEMVWVDDPTAEGRVRQRLERNEYSLQMNPFGVMEAYWEKFYDQEKEPVETAFLGIGRIPWILMKSDAKSLRGSRGESPITTQAMETADRLNAVEQVSYLISRYNSHANVAVIGDGASLKLESDGRVEKDVADVLTFPGGTALQVLTLPTDPQMIEHQRKVLTDALFGCFGLTRVDTDTVGTLGSISGYALEILNQKQESTTGRITRTWRKCWNDLIDLVLDCHAWWALGQVQMLDNHGEWQDLTDDEMMAVLGSVDDPDAPIVAVTWWNVDPAATFPNRTLKISMGTGYIVDDVMIRDDFTAGLISRKEALRQRGMGPTQIDQIEQEIGEEKPPTPEIGAFGQGGTTGGARLQPVGTKAGSTLGTAKAAR